MSSKSDSHDSIEVLVRQALSTPIGKWDLARPRLHRLRLLETPYSTATFYPSVPGFNKCSIRLFTISLIALRNSTREFAKC